MITGEKSKCWRTKVLLIVMSLFLALPTLAGEARKMVTLCTEHVAKLDYSALRRDIPVLMRCAKQEHDDVAMGYAYYSLGTMHLNSGQAKKAKIEYDKALDLSRRCKHDSLMSITLCGLGIYEASINSNLYVAQYYFQQALQAAIRCGLRQQIDGIYINLANLASEQKDTAGLKYALVAYRECEKKNNNYGMRLAAIVVSKLYNFMGKNNIALEWANRAIDINQKGNFNAVSDLYSLKASILTDMGKLDEAEVYARKAIDSLKESNVMEKPSAYLQMAVVKNKKGDYIGSNSYLTQSLTYSEQTKIQECKVSIYKLFADNYKKLGDNANMMKYNQLAQNLENKTLAANREHMKNERQLIIEVAEKDKEVALSEAKAHQHFIISMSLAAGAFLLLVICIVIWINYRRRQRLYQNIVRRNKEALGREEELKKRLKESRQQLLESESNKESVDEVKSEKPSMVNAEKMDVIYESLCRLMEEKKIYTDSQLNRDTLAEKLETNRTYLTQVVSVKSGMNIPAFINHYRIEEAVRILSDREKTDYPLKQLCSDLGFASMSTFYKLFNKQVGMSPSAYRKSLIEIEK